MASKGHRPQKREQVHHNEVKPVNPPIPVKEEEEFVRLSVVFRIQHLAMIVSMVILIITGLMLKFPDSAISQGFFHLIGGVAVSGIIHRVGAVILIALGTFHMFYIICMEDGRKNFIALLPRFKDFVDVFQNVLYFFSFRKTGPRFARFSYIEKFDYWAVYWGMVVMILSGLMLWFHNFTMSRLPKIFLDVAREAHSDEALLATLAIVVWHFYNVHFNPSRFPMSRTFIDGKISKEEMLRDHPVEYEEIMARRAVTQVPGLAEPDADLDSDKALEEQ